MLTQLFDNADRKVVERISYQWQTYRNAEGTGKLDRAFAKKNYVMLRQILDEVQYMTREYIRIAVRRYAEMLAEDE